MKYSVHCCFVFYEKVVMEIQFGQISEWNWLVSWIVKCMVFVGFEHVGSTDACYKMCQWCIDALQQDETGKSNSNI